MTLLSPYCFFLFLRWLARTAYGIPGTDLDDFLLGCFCPCCSINQVLQTTKSYGYPPKAGKAYNQQNFSSKLGSGSCSHCLQTFFCTPCTIGTIAEKGLGMPWWMGCTMLTPCSIRNIMRYHYRIKGNDVLDELCLPCSFYTTASFLAFIFFLFSPCICIAMCPTYTGFLTQLSHETDLRDSGGYHRYLVGYTLAVGSHTSVNLSRISEIGTELHGPNSYPNGSNNTTSVSAVAQQIVYNEQETTLNAELLQNQILSDDRNPLPPPPPVLIPESPPIEGDFMYR